MIFTGSSNRLAVKAVAANLADLGSVPAVIHVCQ